MSDEGPLFEPLPLTEPANADPGAQQPAPPAGGVAAPTEAPAVPRLEAPTPQAPPSTARTEAPVAVAPTPARMLAPPSPCERDGLLLCDDFEADSPDEFPSSTAWLPELAGCGTHRVDASGPAFSGVNALRATEGAYPECMLHADVGGRTELYVQSRVYLGPGAELVSKYVSLLELGTSPSVDDPELRVGLRPQGEGPCAGVDLTGSGLVGGTQTECSGTLLDQERWYCLGVHVVRSGQDVSIDVSVDDGTILATELSGSSAWAGSELFLKLGRAAYGASGQGAIWHDDVLVSGEPIGCSRAPTMPAQP